MKRLDRYVWRELLVPFLIGTLTVVLMFQVNYLIFIYREYSVNAVPVEAVLKLILYETPAWLNQTLPVGTSLGASLAMARLTRESEITAMRSAGASILRIMRPVIVFGLLVAVGNFLLAEMVMPPAKRASRELFAQAALLAQAPEFKSNVTLNLQNKLAIIGTVARGPNDTIQLSNILLYERPQSDQVVLSTAETGSYKDGVWRIMRPRTWLLVGDHLMDVTSFKRNEGELIINEPVRVESLFVPRESDELTLVELQKSIEEFRKQGQDVRGQEILYHTRFAVPAACIVFAFVSPIFAVFFARSGAFMGVLISFVAVILYYNAFIISTKILGPNGLVAPWLAAWLPNLIFGGLGILAQRRLE